MSQLVVEEFQFYFHIIYIIYGFFAISGNTLLIYLILKHSPKSFKLFKILQINTAANQIAHAACVTFMQQRRILGPTTTVYLPFGPCRLLGPLRCLSVFNISNFFYLNANFSILISMHYRWAVVRTFDMSRRVLIFDTLLSYFITFGTMTAALLRRLDLSKDREMLESDYPSDNDIWTYGPFAWMKNGEIIFVINTYIMRVVATVFPVIIIYLRKKIKDCLEQNINSFSAETKKISDMLVKTLLIQAMVPLPYIVNGYLMIFFSDILHVNLTFFPFFQSILLSVTALVDPYLSMYYIQPYKRWCIRHLFPCRNPLTESIKHLPNTSQSKKITISMDPKTI